MVPPPCFSNERAIAMLNAALGVIRPLHLHSVVADLLKMPGADVANLSIILIVPSLPRNGVRYSLAQFVGTGCRKGVEDGEVVHAALAIGIGHHGVENLPVNGIVIATECLAGAYLSLRDGRTAGQIDKVKRVGSWLWECAVGDSIVEHLLNIAIGYG